MKYGINNHGPNDRHLQIGRLESGGKKIASCICIEPLLKSGFRMSREGRRGKMVQMLAVSRSRPERVEEEKGEN